jgi:hypothetical protein
VASVEIQGDEVAEPGADLIEQKPPGRRYARSVSDPLKRRHRSRASNGKVLIPGLDQRSPWIRRCRDVISDHIVDLGGVDNCSTAERSIIRRASVLTVELELLEAKFALAGQATADDLDLYQRTAANLRRLLEAVGIQRRPRDVSTLSEYLASLPKEPVIDAEAETETTP